jgi:hypothetical protein
MLYLLENVFWHKIMFYLQVVSKHACLYSTSAKDVQMDKMRPLAIMSCHKWCDARCCGNFFTPTIVFVLIYYFLGQLQLAINFLEEKNLNNISKQKLEHYILSDPNLTIQVFLGIFLFFYFYFYFLAFLKNRLLVVVNQ